MGEKHLWVFVSQTPKPWGDKGKRHTIEHSDVQISRSYYTILYVSIQDISQDNINVQILTQEFNNSIINNMFKGNSTIKKIFGLVG